MNNLPSAIPSLHPRVPPAERSFRLWEARLATGTASLVDGARRLTIPWPQGNVPAACHRLRLALRAWRTHGYSSNLPSELQSATVRQREDSIEIEVPAQVEITVDLRITDKAQLDHLYTLTQRGCVLRPLVVSFVPGLLDACPAPEGVHLEAIHGQASTYYLL